MPKTVHILLRHIIQQFHLTETENTEPCGKKYKLLPEDADGSFWIYTPNPFVTLIMSDLRFKRDFEYHYAMPGYTYLSYYTELDAVCCFGIEREETPSRLEAHKVYTNAAPFHRSRTVFAGNSRCKGILLLFPLGELSPLIYEQTSMPLCITEETLSKINGQQVHGLDTVCRQLEHFRRTAFTSYAKLFYNSKVNEMMSLYLNALDVAPPAMGRLSQEDLEQIDRITRYLRGHLAENPDLDSLSVIAHMSKRKLTETFRQVTGMTIQDYKTRLRARRAAELLSDPNRQVTDVASEVGFTSASSFSQFFKSQFGFSPNQYRTDKNQAV